MGTERREGREKKGGRTIEHKNVRGKVGGREGQLQLPFLRIVKSTHQKRKILVSKCQVLLNFTNILGISSHLERHKQEEEILSIIAPTLIERRAQVPTKRSYKSSQ